MMERAGKNIKRVIIIAAAALLALCMAGIIMVWADGIQIEAPSSAKFTDSAFEKYHDREAESLLGPVGSFHLVAFDTLHINAHCNGNFATNNLQANSNNGTNNYGTEINYAKKFTSGRPGAGDDDILVVEDGNTISKADNGNAIMLNGSKLDHIKHIIKSNGFINLTDWKKQTQAVSDKYKSHSTSDGVITDFSDRNNQKIMVKKAGSFLNLTATSNGLNGIASDTPLRIDVGSGNNVVINVDCRKVPANGTLSLPDCKTILKGQELNNRVVTEFNENFITWNFTNIPSGMTIDAKLMIGSILAPGATVNLNQNLNGTCAADTIYVKAESHRDDSRGTTPNTPTEEKGSLTFTKTFGGDNITKADLSNISFTVTGPNNYSKTFTLGEIKQDNGTYSKTLTGLTLGKYTVTEKNADQVEGYSLVKEGTITSGETTLTTSSKTATIALNDNYQPTKPEQPTEEKGSLTFTKTFGGDNITKADLSNISFTVTGPNNYSKTFTLGEIKQDNGTYSKTLTDLTLGKYTVTEKNADQVEGYSLVKEGTITSGETTLTTSSKTATIALNDNYQPTKPEQPTEEKGSLTFTKTFGGDNITKADLSNISFTVTGPNNYSKTFTLGEIKKDDGTYSKTLTDLTLGKYTVTEENADKVDGYTLVKQGTITSGESTLTTSSKSATIALSDNYQPTQPVEEKGSLTFTKTFGGDNITKADLSNIKFTVTGPNNYSQTFTLGEIKKDDGTYSKTLTGLTLGNYTVTENNADKVDGYTLVTNESVTSKSTTVEKDKKVTVDLKDTYTPNQTTKKYALKVRKTENIDEKDTNKRISGSRCAMFKWVGQSASAKKARLLSAMMLRTPAAAAPANQTNSDDKFANLTRADITEAKGWKKINESDTDTNGEIEKHDNDITPGVYAVMEEVPPAGYQRTANPAIIRLNEDGSKTMISNANGAAKLETEGAVQFLRWRETATNVEINKVDEKGNSIKGAVLAIYDKDGAPVETWTSDGTKHRITAKLVAGETYTLKELKAPEGYEKAADETFKVESKDIVGIDQYIQGGIEMIDKTTPTTPDKPTTPTQPSGPKDTQTTKPAQTVAKGVKTGDPTTIGGLIALIAAAGAVTVLTVKRLRDAE